MRLLIIFISIDLPGHDHHPEQKHGAYDLKRESRFPLLADAVRLKPGQGSLALAGRAAIQVAITADALLGPIQEDRGLDQAGEPEHEEDEGSQHHDPWEQLALVDEDEHGQEEEEGEGGDGDLVREYPRRGGAVVSIRGNIMRYLWEAQAWERGQRGGRGIPWDPDMECILYGDEHGEDAQYCCRGGDHDEKPEVELSFRPMVFPPSLHHSYLGCHVVEAGCGGCKEKCAWFAVRIFEWFSAWSAQLLSEET